MPLHGQNRFTGRTTSAAPREKCRDTAVNPQAPFMPEWLFDLLRHAGAQDEPLPRAGKFTRREFTTSSPTCGIITAIRAVLSPKNGMACAENEQRFASGTDSR